MISEGQYPICILQNQSLQPHSSSYPAIYQRKYEVGLGVHRKQCRLLEIDAHDQTSRANAAVMSNIKKRLKDAYDSVTFYANKTWTNDCYLYQKTNQELYARHVKIQEAFTEEVTRPRTVRDSIPHSKLAKYSNYVYDEARELSYTPNTNDMTFHYTCQCKDGSVEEPWMLPEVEQLFIWLTYSRDFNLLRYRDLVHFDQVETSKTKHTCTLEDFHKVDPRFFENFERTPGKPRFTKSEPLKDTDLKSAVPPVLNFTTFDDMTVKMKFNLDLVSDSVKNIWKTGRSDDLIPPKKVEIFKSPFDNLFIEEDPKGYKYYYNSDKMPYHFNELQEKANDFRNLQGLTEMLKRIKEPDEAELNLLASTCRTASDALIKSTPAKRLYSDVVQGLANRNSSKSQFDGGPTLLRSESFKDVRLPVVKLTDADGVNQYKFSATSKSKPLANPSNWFDQSWGKHEIKLLQKTEEKKSDVSQTKLTSTSQSLYSKSFPATTTNADTFTGGPISCYGSNFANYQSFCPTNSTVTEYQPADIYSTYNPVNVYASNYYSPLQYQPANLYSNSYSGANLSSNAYTYSPVTYTSQLSSNARNFIQQKQSTVHYNAGQQQWIMHQYRTPSLYNVNHIPPQPCFLLPPQIPKQQRWMPAGHYVRPPTPQNVHLNTTPTQNWSAPGQLYRTSSAQHICQPSQVFETASLDNSLKQRYKSKKINSQVNMVTNKVRSKSPESQPYSIDKAKCNPICKKSLSSETTVPPGNGKFFVNSSVNDVTKYKVLVKKNSISSQTTDANKLLPSTLKDLDADSKPLPVITTNSDDLERQALEEYQSSNESFYKDLERQAEEQYDDSENSLGPPNEDLYFGGRASLCECFSVYFSDLLSTYFEVYIYHYA